MPYGIAESCVQSFLSCFFRTAPIKPNSKIYFKIGRDGMIVIL